MILFFIYILIIFNVVYANECSVIRDIDNLLIRVKTIDGDPLNCVIPAYYDKNEKELNPFSSDFVDDIGIDDTASIFFIQNSTNLQVSMYNIFGSNTGNSGGIRLSVSANDYKYCSNVDIIELDDADEESELNAYNYYDSNAGFGQFSWNWAMNEYDGLILGRFIPRAGICINLSYSNKIGINGFNFYTGKSGSLNPQATLSIVEEIKNYDEFQICFEEYQEPDNTCSTQANICQNGGTCVDNLCGISCNCVDGFTGEFCEIDLASCANNPCKNGATCISHDTGDFTCQCANDYYGDTCELVSACNSSPCENGGICSISNSNDFQCECTAEFTGETCEIVAGICSGDSAEKYDPDNLLISKPLSKVLIITTHDIDRDFGWQTEHAPKISQSISDYLSNTYEITDPDTYVKFFNLKKSNLAECNDDLFNDINQIIFHDFSINSYYDGYEVCLDKIANIIKSYDQVDYIFDARSVGSFVEEEFNPLFLLNYYENLRIADSDFGVTFLSFKHFYTKTTNYILEKLNFNLMDISADFGGEALIDAKHPLYTFPFDARRKLGSSIIATYNDTNSGTITSSFDYYMPAINSGITPYGLQPNGLVLNTVGIISDNRESIKPNVVSTTLGYYLYDFTAAVCTPLAVPEISTCDELLVQGSVMVPRERPYTYKWWIYATNEDTWSEDKPTYIEDTTSFTLDFATLYEDIGADRFEQYTLVFGITDKNGVKAFASRQLQTLPSYKYSSTFDDGYYISSGWSNTMYPHGECVGDIPLDKGDDKYFQLDISDNKFPYWGELYDKIYVNTDGIISFLTPLQSYTYPCFTDMIAPTIAAFWSDLDTSAFHSGTVLARDSNMDELLLDVVAKDIGAQYYGSINSSFNPTYAAVFTWNRVGKYQAQADILISFQIVLATDGVNSFVFLNYPENGLPSDFIENGNEATVGFSSGRNEDPNLLNDYYTCGSTDIMDLPSKLGNTGTNGRYLFKVDGNSLKAADANADFNVANLDSLSTDIGTWEDGACNNDKKACILKVDWKPEIEVKFSFSVTQDDSNVYYNDQILFASDNKIIVEHLQALNFEVISGDGSASKTYTVTIKVGARNGPLNNFILTNSNNDEILTLTPAIFNPLSFEYTLTISSDITHVSVNATGITLDSTLEGTVDASAFISTSTNGNLIEDDIELTYLGTTLIQLSVYQYVEYIQLYNFTISMTKSVDTSLKEIQTNTGTVSIDSHGQYMVTYENNPLILNFIPNHPQATIYDDAGTATFNIGEGASELHQFTIIAEDTNYEETYFVHIYNEPSDNVEATSISVHYDGITDTISDINDGDRNFEFNIDSNAEEVSFSIDLQEGSTKMTYNYLDDVLDLDQNDESLVFEFGYPSINSISKVVSIQVTASTGNKATYQLTLIRAAITDITADFGTCTTVTKTITNSKRSNVASFNAAYTASDDSYDSSYIHLIAHSNDEPNYPPYLRIVRDDECTFIYGCTDPNVEAENYPANSDQYSTITLISTKESSSGRYYVEYNGNHGNDVTYPYDITLQFCTDAAKPSSLNVGTNINLANSAFDLYVGTPQGLDIAEYVFTVSTDDVSNDQIKTYIVNAADNSVIDIEKTNVFDTFDAATNPDSNGDYSSSIDNVPTDAVILFGIYADPNADDTQNSYELDIVASIGIPTITFVTPLSGSGMGGYTMTISGKNFDANSTYPSGAVMIGARECTDAKYDDDRNIQCTVPSGSGYNLDITVAINGLTSNPYSKKFGYQSAIISSISTIDGKAPNTGNFDIIISGANFGESISEVSISGTQQGSSNEITCDVKSVTFEKIICTLPAGEGIYDIQANVNDGVSNIVAFPYDGPIISSAIEDDNTDGKITISGKNFGTNTDVTVNIKNEHDCVIASRSDTEIICNIGAIEFKNPVIVTVNTQSFKFLFIPECSDDCPPGWFNNRYSCL